MLYKIIVVCLSVPVSVQNDQILLNLPEGSKCTWNGVDGKCSNLMTCRSARDGLRRKIHPPICGFEGVTPIVCCTDCEQIDSTKIPLDFEVGLRHKQSSSKARINCLKYLEKLSYPCRPTPQFLHEEKMSSQRNCYQEEQPLNDEGKINAFGDQITTTEKHVLNEGYFIWRPSPPISLGYNARRSQYPHMALLGYGDELETAQWLSGGFVISERYILTAARCISSPSVGPVKYIAVGILRRTDPAEWWLRYHVKRIVRHPEYASPSKYHDIALLETDTEIQFSMAVLPACLHTELETGDEAEATGWGALGHHLGLADTLQAVKLQRYDEEKCSELYPKHRHLLRGYNHTTQLCFGHHEDAKDTCEGDSGGPLQIANDVSSCAYDVIGVTSYGRQCGVTAGSGIYTRVYHYLPWIESVVWP